MSDGLLVGVVVGLQVTEAVGDGVGLAVIVPLGVKVGVMVGVVPVMPPADFNFKHRGGAGQGGGVGCMTHHTRVKRMALHG